MAEDQHTGKVEVRLMNAEKYRVLAFDDEKDILELIKITLSCAWAMALELMP